ncbi:uncharacterized protein LOC109283930 [Alligator mississippiensis]|uniref:uncharacterized protein LOC109283930 n=1 Tax=Alligator mississippiensis TaxID=8496 RepID=UPI00090701F5|nr:uncharacterized protein LOC109283930 [Alligator mississippiensis]
MELEGLKVSMVEKIVDMMENISVEADRRNILAYSIDAIRSLRELKLSLEPGLELRLMRAAIKKSFLAIGHESHCNQVMQRLYVEYLQGLLCRFLFSAPSLGKLYSIWEHFTFWMETPDAQSRALGMKIVTGVLAFAVQLLPQFEGSPELPEVGDMAACLGLSINDPVESISQGERVLAGANPPTSEGPRHVRGRGAAVQAPGGAEPGPELQGPGESRRGEDAMPSPCKAEDMWRKASRFSPAHMALPAVGSRLASLQAKVVPGPRSGACLWEAPSLASSHVKG